MDQPIEFERHVVDVEKLAREAPTQAERVAYSQIATGWRVLIAELLGRRAGGLGY